MQLLGLVSALGIAVVMGLVAGKFIGLFYEEREETFFEDASYFDRGLFLNRDEQEVKYERAAVVQED